MKNILMIILTFLIAGSSLGQERKSLFFRTKIGSSLIINNQISIDKLYYPGENFENIADFGIPKDSSYVKSPVDEWWTFTYEGFSLKFADYTGVPELSEIMIDGENACIKIEGEVVRPMKSARKIRNLYESSRSADTSIELIQSDMVITKKYGDGYSFLELILKSDGETIDKIYFRRQIL